VGGGGGGGVMGGKGEIGINPILKQNLSEIGDLSNITFSLVFSWTPLKEVLTLKQKEEF